MMKKNRKDKKEIDRSSNRLNGLTIVIIMLVFSGIIAFQIRDLKQVNREKDAQLAVKNEEYEKESERTNQLEDERIRVQTKGYIEEEAKKIGYVYDDEIIFKNKNAD